ncbi:P-II family nitrogen regulator [Desulfitobacterium chlororespirans]|uniref:Nitrogen regulatory protein P-II family n=1 Tax=Desulfitobacterium chlororespirans DSM 11544 TaxID=1121395 RepID=A0A1M7TRE0_9FIRM|nr:P-II family nitrogen regulator [Desulfitobacterium chlororespirans]SHN73317.1 nitrogen regulatory protein P-II family [Desulfitobacterium chlororespirans DSM 11544]
MKMIKAILRPEAVDSIADSLADAGFISMTKVNAFGRGKQKGIQRGSVHYDELPKTILMTVVEDEEVEHVLKIIQYKAYTGSFGDGKVFVSPVDRVFTVRTSAEEL